MLVVNQRLRGAMLNAELTAQHLASLAGVDVKSVNRWIGEDRVPHPITRLRVARALNQQETFLWPTLLETPEACVVAEAELEHIWPTRRAVSPDTWHAMFSRATSRLDILVYAGGFLIEALDLADVLSWKSDSGVTIRILIGDPGSDAVRTRALEEQLPWLPDRCRTTAQYLGQVSCLPSVSIRLHGTTLYASMFRFDDTVLVNQHTFAAWACSSPVYKISRARSGYLFDYYSAAFDRVWHAGAGRPAPQSEVA